MRKFAILSVLSLSIGLTAAPARADTLADALAQSYEHNGLLDQNRALLRAADEDVAQAVALLRPVISYLASINYAPDQGAPGSTDFTNQLQLNASLLVFDGGATRLQIDALKETVLSTRAALINVEQSVLFRGVDAYLGVRRSSEQLALRQNNLRLLNQELQAARDRFEVGEVTRTDVSLAEARLASARSLLASAEGTLAQARAEYQVATGRSPQGLQPVTRLPQIPGAVSEAVQVGLRRHPLINQAQHEVAATELLIMRAEAALNPQLSLRGGVNLQEGEFNESVGVQLSGPIYSGGALSSQIRQAQARRDAARAGLHITRHNIEQQVVNAYALLAAARASREATSRQITAARSAFQGIREEATLGARTTLDVLNAEQELLDAQATFISAQADEVVAAYAVLQAMGMLTVDHLGLGVQSYDPAAYYNLVDDAPTVTSQQGQALDRVLRAIGND